MNQIFRWLKNYGEKIDRLNQRRDSTKAINGEDVDLGGGDVLKSNSEGAVFARNIVK